MVTNLFYTHDLSKASSQAAFALPDALSALVRLLARLAAREWLATAATTLTPNAIHVKENQACLPRTHRSIP